jgi:hypothetical protein
MSRRKSPARTAVGACKRADARLEALARKERVARIRTLLEHCRATQQGPQELTVYVEIAEMLQGAVQASMHAMFRQI